MKSSQVRFLEQIRENFAELPDDRPKREASPSDKFIIEDTRVSWKVAAGATVPGKGP